MITTLRNWRGVRGEDGTISTMGYHIAVTVAACNMHVTAVSSRTAGSTDYTTVCVKVEYGSNTVFTACMYTHTSSLPHSSTHPFRHPESGSPQIPDAGRFTASSRLSLEQERPSRPTPAAQGSERKGRSCPLPRYSAPTDSITTQTQRRSDSEADERWAAWLALQGAGGQTRQTGPDDLRPGVGGRKKEASGIAAALVYRY
jgi:hypothetical protein